MIPIKPKLIDGVEIHFVDFAAKNESIVRVNFYGACKCRVASTVVRIPSDQELTEANVWQAAGVIPLE